jgi:hypothetical protein
MAAKRPDEMLAVLRDDVLVTSAEVEDAVTALLSAAAEGSGPLDAAVIRQAAARAVDGLNRLTYLNGIVPPAL